MKTKKKIRFFARRLVVLASLFIVAALAHGQTLEVLHSFQGPDGWDPHSPLVQGTDGSFYGTTLYGGDQSLTNFSIYEPDGWGTVFKMTPDGVLTTLVIFNGTNGASPSGLTLGNDGNLYGTAAGGNFGWGTVFRMTPAGMLTTLASFNGTNGGSPIGGLVPGDDGNFYGVTIYGGNLSLNHGDGYGVFFKLATNGTLSAVPAFNQANGWDPNAGLAKGNDGNFYGTTLLGGAYGNGTIFRITTNGSLTRLLSINFQPSAKAWGLMQASNGMIYGATTPDSGLGSGGTVFRVTPAGQLTTVISFDDLGYPVGYGPPLIQATDGNLYGVTGGYAFRTVFLSGIVYKLMPDGTWTTVVPLDDTCALGASLVQGTDGNLYGTARGDDLSLDDAYGPGAIFRVVLPPTHLPPLSLVLSGNTVLITWPASATNAVLETTDVLPPSWAPVPITPVQIGDQMAVTVNIDSQSQFFRLSQQ